MMFEQNDECRLDRRYMELDDLQTSAIVFSLGCGSLSAAYLGSPEAARPCE